MKTTFERDLIPAENNAGATYQLLNQTHLDSPPSAPAVEPTALRRRTLRLTAVATVIAAAAGGIAVGAETGRGPTGAAAANASLPGRVHYGTARAIGAALTAQSSFPGSGSHGINSLGASTLASSYATADAPSIAAQVDPGIVDVTSTLGDQGAIAAGTGMVVTSSGEVLTNNHVIQGATSIEVLLAGTGPSYTAHVVGADPTDDVALLQIDGASGLQTVTLGDSSAVSVGDPVVALGNALGRQGPPSVSQGHVTALNQTITATDQGGGNPETLNGLIQIDAPIQPGDSGGPLVDASGKVIGMDSAADGGGFNGQAPSTVGFAIPINSAMAIVKQLEAGGASPSSVPTGHGALLDVDVQDATAQGVSGALVVQVPSGSPAASAGIVAGDVIVGFDGQPIDCRRRSGLRSAPTSRGMV
jgi:S1-C subfamily serine protease